MNPNILYKVEPHEEFGKINHGYRFSFNGKEKDNEVKGDGNSLDFGGRIYDPRIGRWLSLDPLAQNYPYATPYNFVLNTPIQAKDPDGKLVIFINGYRGSDAVKDDFKDPFGTRRSITRFFTEEKIYKNDHFNYWGSLADKFMQRIGDYNAVYADGSSHALSTEAYRNERGKEAGEALLKKIEAGEVTMKAGETIKLVSHSQGGAYAAGMAEVLVKAGYKVEVSYNIAPKQPGDIKNSDQISRIVQYSSPDDFIAPQSSMPGADEIRNDVVPSSKQGATSGGGHTTDSYHDNNSTKASSDKSGIFAIPQGEKGAVEHKKDNPK